MPHILSRLPCHLLSAIIALGCFLTHSDAQPVGSPPSWREIARHRQPAEWYGTDEAVRIADNVLLYQNANGGWGKNVDRARLLSDSEKARVVEESKTVRTTIDNKATVTEIRYLALVHEQTENTAFREGALRGIRFLLEAQYDNGGWPQYYPIRKGYYEHITYNDGAMIGVMRLLRDVADGSAPFDFVGQDLRSQARTAIDRGLEVVLKTQIVVDGQLTAWCAQHDRESFAPAKARAYELPSISGGESAGIVLYLMSIDNPDHRVIRAVESAVAWYERSRVTGVKLVRKEDASLPKGYDLVVVEDPEAPPLWARFYEIETNRPIYVGRDGVIKYSLAEIEHERRVGYGYLRNYAARLLEVYPEWKAKWIAE